MEELYKRKSYKFSSEAISRHSRHAEAFKAREISRFERVSMIRSMTLDSENSSIVSVETEVVLERNDNATGTSITTAHAYNGDSQESEITKSTEKPIQKEVKMPSRLESLRRWKQERIIKQEMEKKQIKPAFYAGAKAIAPKGPSLIKTNLKTSFLGQKSMSVNTSKTSERKIAPPNVQNARIPYNFKAAASSYSNKMKEANSVPKKPVSVLPATKNAAVPKATSWGNRSNSTCKTNPSSTGAKTVKENSSASKLPAHAPLSKPASLKRDTPVLAKRITAQSSLPVSKNGSTSKIAGSTNKANLTSKGITPSTFNRSNSASKISSQRATVPKSTNLTSNNNNTSSSSAKTFKESSINKFPARNAAVPKATSWMNRSNSTCKTNPTSTGAKTVKENSSASKLPAQVSTVNRPGISRLPNKQVQKAPSANVVKPGIKAPSKPVSKPQGLKPGSSSNLQKNTLKPSNSSLPKPTATNKVLSKDTLKKIDKKATKTSEELGSECTTGELEDTSKTIVPEVTFNCDVSLISGSASFAPVDFQFRPPALLSSFFDDDPLEAFEQAKKFMTRTSTPSKRMSQSLAVKSTPPVASVEQKSSPISEKSDENQPSSASSAKLEVAVKDPRTSDAYPLQKYFDDDPLEAFEIVKKKFMFRVSTPVRDISNKNFSTDCEKTLIAEDSKEQPISESTGMKSDKQYEYGDNPCDTFFNTISLMSESPGILVSDADMFNDDENINDIDLKLVKNSPTKPSEFIENIKEVVGIEENLIFNFNQVEKCIECVNSANEAADVNVGALQVASDVDKDPKNVEELLFIDNCEKIVTDSSVTPETGKNYEVREVKFDSVLSPETEAIVEALQVASNVDKDPNIVKELLFVDNCEKIVIDFSVTPETGKDDEVQAVKFDSVLSPETDTIVEALQVTSNVDKDPKNVEDVKELLFVDNCEKIVTDSLVTPETGKNNEARAVKFDFVASPETETIVNVGAPESETSDVFLVINTNNDVSLVSQLPTILEEATASQVCSGKDGSTDAGSLSTTLINEFPETNDNLLETFDLSKTEESFKSQEKTVNLKEEQDSGSFDDKDIKNVTDRKSTGAVPKRVSMLKKMSFLNSIAESPEAVGHNSASTPKSVKKPQLASTPRRSPRLLQVPNRNESKVEMGSKSGSNILSPLATPGSDRRNKVHKAALASEISVEDSKCITPRRRSMRLINLNTPERDFAGSPLRTNITGEFEKLRITSENDDPNLLFDVENNFKPVSRRVSLLYSPKRRQSCRKSIRGDLMSFSPSDN